MFYKKLIYFLLSLKVITFQTCDSPGPGYFKFLSKTVLKIKPGEKNIELKGKCFNSILLTFKEEKNKYIVSIELKDKISYLCVEFLIISSGKSSNWKFFLFPQTYNFEFSLKSMSKFEKTHIKKKGLQILRSCDTSNNWLSDIIMTLKAFLESPKNTTSSNLTINLIKQMTGYEFKLRKNSKKVKLPKKEISSGDFFGITRLDALGSIILLGSGSKIYHSVIALWKSKELYICESQQTINYPKKGVVCETYDIWLELMDELNASIVHMPLKEPLRQKFDVERAWAFVDEMIGQHYGYRNFLFGFYDTVHGNLPDVVDLGFVNFFFGYLDPFFHSYLDLVFFEGFSKRLGMRDLGLSDIWEEIYKRDLSIEELMAVVEDENWVYSDGHSYVCSAFVVAVYKRAGLFGDLKINATEFTPKDLYELNFFDVSGDNIPEECLGFAPYGYCQLTGNLDMNLGKVSFVEPYDNMDEGCPTKIPDFSRSDGC